MPSCCGKHAASQACCMQHAAGTWVNINKVTEDRLNALQHWFLRLALRRGQGSLVAAILWAIRIYTEKIMMVTHLRSLDVATLARRNYKEQKKQSWPGLARETATICKKLIIEDSVIDSPCLSVCAIRCIFLGLSLALRSHDQFPGLSLVLPP